MTENAESPKFAPVPLGKISPEESLCTDVYVKIGDKYIKFKEKDDVISTEKYDLFIAKDVKEIYISIDQVQDFMDWLQASKEKAIDETVLEIGEEYREIAVQKEEIKEKIYETFAEQTLTSGTVGILQGTVENFIEDVSQKQIPSAILAKLYKQSVSVADHSVNVANLAVFIAMVCGNGHQFVLENVYLGGLFHDYAKAKIPAEILENRTSARYSQAIQDHPMKGAKMLRNLNEIPHQVYSIVEQHHEQFNGQGFPKGLRGEDIYTLAQYVSIANVVDNTLSENANKPHEMHKIAVKVLEYDRGKMFDPQIIPRVAQALKIAFKKEKKKKS